MKTGVETIKAFYAAIEGKDKQGIRKLLSSDFTFRGPMRTFDNPDVFAESMVAMAMEGGPRGSRFITEGDSIAHICTWQMTAPKRMDLPMCEIFTLADGKIAGIELYFDSKHFAQG